MILISGFISKFLASIMKYFAEFMLTDSIRQKIVEAQARHIAIGSRVCFSSVEYFEMNRQTIKRSKLSPDSIMQLAIQLTFYKLFKQFVPSYESCSTAVFLKVNLNSFINF